ncbi:DNA cytosine methyltransferase (plasmid) [Deinococcus actinosclerus]|nr:DNA cytosine methyltransferase [Deinococcus actinosclerus]
MQKKARRIQEGQPPRVLDIFSGCGGISLGFHAAGFSIDANVEIDPDAAASHAFNFHSGHPRSAQYAQARDITKTLPHELAEELGLLEDGLTLEETIDVIVGGPPCQAYARVGRSKLREIQQHPEAFLHDQRANLFEMYLAYVAAFQPLALLMENVPDIMNQRGQNVAQIMAEALEDSGYTVGYTLLNAAFYGVPQMRERMFLVAYREELGQTVTFPPYTHHVDLPPGYEGSRQVALKSLRRHDLFGAEADHHYIQPPTADPQLPPAVTAQDALQDLPVILDHLEGKLKRGARRFEDAEPLPYRTPASKGTYAYLMRHWDGFGERGGIRDHAIRFLPRDYPIFARMQPGDQYPEAKQVAIRLFNDKLREAAQRGEDTSTGSPLWTAFRDAIVPPYDDSKFPNKWRKMEPDMPARTLMAHLGKDGYSHIHYDSAQARTISVREAARLQSFPDGFVFKGTMNPAFKQIGNAVPPLLVRPIAQGMLNALQAGVAGYLTRLQQREAQPA